MSAATFTTTVELGGKTATGFEVPASAMEQLASGRKPAVTVTINGHSYPSTVATMGGRPMVPLSAENRASAGVAAGDQVEVSLVLDTKPRELVVPPELAAALAEEPAAKAFFDSLSYSNRRWHTLQVDGAKTDETRQRRIAKSVAMLKAGKAR